MLAPAMPPEAGIKLLNSSDPEGLSSTCPAARRISANGRMVSRLCIVATPNESGDRKETAESGSLAGPSISVHPAISAHSSPAEYGFTAAMDESRNLAPFLQEKKERSTQPGYSAQRSRFAYPLLLAGQAAGTLGICRRTNGIRTSSRFRAGRSMLPPVNRRRRTLRAGRPSLRAAGCG